MIDVDSDGDRDVVLAVENGISRLYLNDGKGRLTWKQGAFGTTKRDNEHVRVADFDHDGHMDVVFVAEDTRQHQLYFGDGKGGFADASDQLPRRSQGNALAVGDVNGDALPDIVIGNSSEAGEGGAKPDPHNFLWLNDASRPGRFIDASDTHLPRNAEDAQGIALADMDGDGDLDMVVANQTPPNKLLLNDGKGHFNDASNQLDLRTPLETREVHVFDANRDGKPDILFLNLTSNNKAWDKNPQSRLLVNDGKARFRDETAARLPKHRFSSWGGTVIDLNGDRAPDLLVGAIQVPGFTPLQLRAWTNDGRGRFADTTAAVVPATMVGRSWSMATGDLDGDGKPDILVGGWGTQVRLLLTGPAPAAD
ncbi:FG-GAP repeat domain-containing protein [Sphingomonas faeni]|uniref:FG-GAP repeat domain-containing protein n=1 Tax=Sphingomonas faeni TaxID=185950 RepID=UPI00241343F8|nr:VCBS repeat-containing protein [Sphingomonas faeni]